MAKDARLASIVFIKLHIAHPQQGLRRSVARMLRWIETRMNVNRQVIFVVVRQLMKKVQMLWRNAVFDLAASIVQILLCRDTQTFSDILLEGSFTSRNRGNPKVGGAVDKVQQHLFV